jgi:hypothetical protein
MPAMMRVSTFAPKLIGAVLLPLALAACGTSEADNLDDLDRELTANRADPAVMAALQDQIMVDPSLAAQANHDAIRPPLDPYAAPMPAEMVASNTDKPEGGLMRAPAPVEGKCDQCTVASQSMTLGALAAGQPDRRTSACAGQLRYSARWASRLPNDLPVHPQGRVVEAAGADQGGCTLRIVSFSAPMPMQAMLDWYYTRAMRAGYTAEHRAEGEQHVLGGARARDGGAYVLFVKSRADGGTDIDLMANNGV